MGLIIIGWLLSGISLHNLCYTKSLSFAGSMEGSENPVLLPLYAAKGNLHAGSTAATAAAPVFAAKGSRELQNLWQSGAKDIAIFMWLLLLPWKGLPSQEAQITAAAPVFAGWLMVTGSILVVAAGSFYSKGYSVCLQVIYSKVAYGIVIYLYKCPREVLSWKHLATLLLLAGADSLAFYA